MQRQLLHFVAVGGGPIGVEFIGELSDLIREDLAFMYPDLLAKVKITIIDVSSRILPMFDEKLATFATEAFSSKGIQVKTSTQVCSVTNEGVHLGNGEVLKTSFVLWATGISANPLTL